MIYVYTQSLLTNPMWHKVNFLSRVKNVIFFNWNHFEMRLLNLRIIFYLLRTFVLILVVVCFFGYFFFVFCFFISLRFAKFHLWPSSCDLPRPRIGMLSVVTVSQVITAFNSCCLSHHVFDQGNLWPAWWKKKSTTKMRTKVRNK